MKKGCQWNRGGTNEVLFGLLTREAPSFSPRRERSLEAAGQPRPSQPYLQPPNQLHMIGEGAGRAQLPLSAISTYQKKIKRREEREEGATNEKTPQASVAHRWTRRQCAPTATRPRWPPPLKEEPAPHTIEIEVYDDIRTAP